MELRSLSRSLLVFLFGMIAATASCLILFTTWIQQSATQAVGQIEGIRTAYELQIHLLRHDRASALGDRPQRQATEEQAIRTGLAKARQHIEGDKERQLIEMVGATISSYLSTPPHSWLERSAAFQKASESASALAEMNLTQARAMQQKAVGDDNLANLLGILILIGCCTISPLVWFMFTRWIFDPLEKLHQGITGFDEVDVTGIVPEAGVQEIRQIGCAFNSLARRLLTLKQTQFRFFASVAHDLRNPLSAIRMSAQLLAQEKSPDETRLPTLEIISRQVVHLDRLVNDLLETSQCHAGEMRLQRERHDLCQIISDAIALYRSTSSRHVITLKAEMALLEFEFDPTRIGQVFNNLISNAIKYSPNGGLIEICINVADEFVVIKVSDEGIGISAADKPKVFDPFARVHQHPQSVAGQGLGLAVVRQIIEQHDGFITVEDNGVRGSIFAVGLPLHWQMRSANNSPRSPSRNTQVL